MNKKAGFTITELMFAMTFLSVLMLVLLGSIIQISRTYNKGITMKRVNQSGRTIGEELTRSLQQSNPSAVKNQSAKGRLCLSEYSFIWSAKSPNNPDNPEPPIENKYNGSSDNVNFAKVKNNGNSLCPDSGPLPDIQREDATELLSDELAVQRLGFTRLSNNTETKYIKIKDSTNIASIGALVSMTYTIASDSGSSEDMIDSSNRCKGGNDNDFCALNTFRVIVYAKG